jgi:hypothetical protein
MMNNPYFMQLIGIILAGAGMVALTAAAHIFGKPLSREERLRTGERRSNVSRLPLNLETIASAGVCVAGISILTWTKFNLCAFLIYWLPDLPVAIRFWLACS